MSADMKPVMAKLSSEKVALHQTQRLPRRKVRKTSPQTSVVLFLAISNLLIAGVFGCGCFCSSQVLDEEPAPPASKIVFPKGKRHRFNKVYRLYFDEHPPARRSGCTRWCCADDGTIPYQDKMSTYAKLFGFNEESLGFFSGSTADLPDEELKPFTRTEIRFLRNHLIPRVIQLEQESRSSRTILWQNNFPRLSDSQCVKMMLHLCAQLPELSLKWLYDCGEPWYIESNDAAAFRNLLIESYTELKFIVLPDGFSIEDNLPSLPMSLTIQPIGIHKIYRRRAMALLTIEERKAFWEGFCASKAEAGIKQRGHIPDWLKKNGTWLETPYFKNIIGEAYNELFAD